MKRAEKNALARQRILEAAKQEFAARGYEAASLSAVCAEHGISKGLIYHHFRDKDELYLLCIAECFGELTARLKAAVGTLSGSVEERLQTYFDARLQFFAAHPLYTGLFADAVLSPPAHLLAQISAARADFDALTIAALGDLLRDAPLRPGLDAAVVVEDVRMYMDFFNLRFKTELRSAGSTERALHQHEERSRRQLEMLLHGILQP